MELVGKIPTVWDETIILEAQLGKYIVEARRSGKDWYLAAINNWTPVYFSISLSFLIEGVHSIESASDGINAAKNPHDYKITKSKVTSADTVKVKLAPGGGFIARILLN
jgi:alpha-glucosidase